MDETVKMDWKIHPLYPRYLISEFGDVLSVNSKGEFKKRLRGTIDTDGYIRYHLIDLNGVKKLIPCHKLVIETFKSFSDGNFEVAHLNGSRLFNHYSNLCWKTSKGNHEDRIIHDTVSQGSKNGRARLDENTVLSIRNEYKSATDRNKRFEIINRYADKFDVSISAIYNCIKKKTWKHI